MRDRAQERGQGMQCTLPNVTNRTVRKSGFFMQALQTRAPLAPAHLSTAAPANPARGAAAGGPPPPGVGAVSSHVSLLEKGHMSRTGTRAPYSQPRFLKIA